MRRKSYAWAAARVLPRRIAVVKKCRTRFGGRSARCARKVLVEDPAGGETADVVISGALTEIVALTPWGTAAGSAARRSARSPPGVSG